MASTTYPAAGSLSTETVTNTYDNNGYQLTAAGQDTYLSAATYQPWRDAYQGTLGSGSNRVQVTTDEWADTHKDKTISVGTEHPGTPGTFDEQFTQQYTWNGDGDLLTERPLAAVGRADQTTDPDHDQHPPRVEADIINLPLVIPMHPNRRGPAARTGR